MLAGALDHTEVTGLTGLLRAAGFRDGNGYTVWSQDQAASEVDAAVLAIQSPDTETPGLALGAGGEWFTAWSADDAVQVLRSQDHCHGWSTYQTLR